MTTYQAMQLNVKNLKNKINLAQSKQEKHHYLRALLIRNIAILIFCIVLISFFTTLFKPENSGVGILTLLAILSFRFTDFNFDTKQSIIALLICFLLCGIGPFLANQLPLILGFIVNFSAILIILILSSHEVNYANHFTFLLGYILLWGNPGDFLTRMLALSCGGIISALVYYRNHRHQQYEHNFKMVINDFCSLNERSLWYLKLSSALALTLYLGILCNFSRTMWIAFTVMSVITIEHEQTIFKLKHRALYVLIGCLIFTLLSIIFPKNFLALAGIVGGILVGFSGSYKWQMAFNCFGALAAAIDLFGFFNAIIIRIIANVIGSVFSFIYHHLFDKVVLIVLDN